MDANSKSPNPALIERAKMLVGVSESLGLPISGPSDPEIEAAIAQVLAESIISSDKPLFELRGPNGAAWKLYLNGHCDGFPEGVVILNSAAPVVDYLIAKVDRAVAGASNMKNQAL